MYYNGQVVWHIPTQKPIVVNNEDDGIWALSGDLNDTTHFLKANPSYTPLQAFAHLRANDLPSITVGGVPWMPDDYKREEPYILARPASIEEAEQLMRSGFIFPAPRHQED